MTKLRSNGIETINWANVLSWSRLVLIAPITVLVIVKLTVAASILVIIAMFTDLFDGIVARRYKLVSAYGSTLDGVIDLVFALATVSWLWIAFPTTQAFWPYVLFVPASLLLLGLVTLVQGKPAPTLHLWTGKCAMTAVFCAFPLIVFGVGTWFLHLTGILCILTQIESFAYIMSGARNPDGRSIIFLLRK